MDDLGLEKCRAGQVGSSGAVLEMLSEGKAVPNRQATSAIKQLDGGFFAIAIMLREFASCTCRREIAADPSKDGPLPAVFRYFAALEAGARRPLLIGGLGETGNAWKCGFARLTLDEIAILNALAMAAEKEVCDQRLAWLVSEPARAGVLEAAQKALAALNAAHLTIQPRL